MPKSRLLLSAALLLAAVSGALAAASNSMGPAHEDRCADLYARSVGRFAYLETRLALTDAQRPAFEQWRDAVLAGRKEAGALCQRQKTGPHDAATIVERQAAREALLGLRLKTLSASHPALEALYKVLTPAQREILDRPPHRFAGHFGFFHHGPMDGPLPHRPDGEEGR